MKMSNEFEGVGTKYISEIFDNYNKSENKCEKCGTHLTFTYTRVPYGDTTYNKTEVYCKNCD